MSAAGTVIKIRKCNINSKSQLKCQLSNAVHRVPCKGPGVGKAGQQIHPLHLHGQSTSSAAEMQSHLEQNAGENVFPKANHTDGLRHFGSLHANILKPISRTLRHACVSPNHYGVTADRATEMVSNKLLCDVTYKSHFWKERTAAGSHSRDADPQPSEPSWGKQTGLHWNHWCQDLCLKTSNSGTDSTK